MFKVPNKYRIRKGALRSTDNRGNNGAFHIQIDNETYTAIAAQDMGWEHVSVSRQVKPGVNRSIPEWDIMCQIKDLFWGDQDWVLQYHPAKTDYINIHPWVLHLWRPMDEPFPTPPKIMV